MQLVNVENPSIDRSGKSCLMFDEVRELIVYKDGLLEGMSLPYNPIAIFNSTFRLPKAVEC